MPPGGSDSEAFASDELAAAEAAAAAARVRVEEAHARAVELRLAVGAARTDPPEPLLPEQSPTGRHRGRLPRPRALGIALGVLLSLCLLSATGYITWRHRQAADERIRTAEFTAAARQGVSDLMSLDYDEAERDVKRMIDGSTGQLRQQFSDTAQDLVKSLQGAKAVTTVTVNAVAVTSMTDDSGEVLVAATTEGHHAAQQQPQAPRTWRIMVSLLRDGGQLKISKVDFAQ
jgi:Mce-associated membrane protein